MSQPFVPFAALVGLAVSLFAVACGNAADLDYPGTQQVALESYGGSPLYSHFRSGFSATQATDKWGYFTFGPAFTGNDGVESTRNDGIESWDDKGLRVISKGTNSSTGNPAFTSTVVSESDPRSVGLPGGVDHVKWLVYANHLSSRGYPGFAPNAQGKVGCEAWIGGRKYGRRGHTVWRAGGSASVDLRFVAFGMNTINVETFIVFDFFMTNEGIYAFYERLQFARGSALGNYAAFSYAKLVAPNHPGELHKLSIVYDKPTNTVRWSVDNQVVQTVSRLGLLIDRSNMIIDHGGTPTEVSLNQLNCGMGTFTLLDAGRVGGGTALAKISTAPDFYYQPAVGAPSPQTFVDNSSADGSRLFGQGAELLVEKYKVIAR